MRVVSWWAAMAANQASASPARGGDRLVVALRDLLAHALVDRRVAEARADVREIHAGEIDGRAAQGGLGLAHRGDQRFERRFLAWRAPAIEQRVEAAAQDRDDR